MPFLGKMATLIHQEISREMVTILNDHPLRNINIAFCPGGWWFPLQKLGPNPSHHPFTDRMFTNKNPPFLGFPMGVLWVSYGFPMVFLWFSYGLGYPL